MQHSPQPSFITLRHPRSLNKKTSKTNVKIEPGEAEALEESSAEFSFIVLMAISSSGITAAEA